jgi:hypothetical protein
VDVHEEKDSFNLFVVTPLVGEFIQFIFELLLRCMALIFNFAAFKSVE